MANSEISQESSIYDFACAPPENTDTLYLKVVGISSSLKITIPKHIDLLSYEKNDATYQDKWEVYYDG